MKAELTENIEDMRNSYAKQFIVASRNTARAMMLQIASCRHQSSICDKCMQAGTILKTISICLSVMSDALRIDKTDELRRVLCEFGRDYLEDFPFESGIDGIANSTEQFPEIIFDKGEF